MKATIRTTIMLMSIFIGTLAASAQSATRGTPHSEQNRKSSATVKSRESSRSSRTSRDKAVRTSKPSQREVTDRRSVNSRSSSDRRQHPGSAANQRHRDESTAYMRRNTSVSNKNNSRSDYRSPERSIRTAKTYRDPKPHSTAVRRNTAVKRNLEPTGYSHRVYYPKKRVKIHVHPAMHRHYKVLYYPAHRNIIWTRKMHRYYVNLYPGYTWRYAAGYHIRTVSVFEAAYNIGEISRVYGRVYGTWHNRETDDLLLFFGGEFPHQEFTMVIPGKIARRYHWRPERYFLGQHVWATGLISSYNGEPEMIIRDRRQLQIY